MDFSNQVWSLEKTPLPSRKQNTKFLQSTLEATQWQKQLFCKQVVLKFYLSHWLKGQRKGKCHFLRKHRHARAFYQSRRLKFLKAPNKTQQKTKKQFILAQNCEHWISMSKITAWNYISLVAYIKILLGRNWRKRSCYFRVGFIHRKKDDIFTETECKRK